ncbi:hypothetical protein AB0I22_07705 [Streptomyces sp. NPDC050610]|uniref:toll/interleukin-1 receptor domain-containing protein n=1 Tax=Streptomyces sp. NPDC050610 TaxID=3157097 RepID=UPI0034187407
MHEVFINFRVMGAKATAHEFKRVLEERFGDGSVFLAGGSIELGSNYVEILDSKVRRSSVLLVLIGPDWLDAPDPKRKGRRALNNPVDWVRRELEEAFECGVLVVPVLLERKTEQLDVRRLPRTLARLAECQFERFSQRTSATDLARLGDRLVRRVPELAALDKRPDTRKKKADTANGPSVSNTGQRGGIGNFQGELGAYIQNSSGPLNTGPGLQINNFYFQLTSRIQGRALTNDERIEPILCFTEQRLRTDHPEDILPLAEQWAQHIGDVGRLTLGATQLTSAANNEDIPEPFQRLVPGARPEPEPAPRFAGAWPGPFGQPPPADGLFAGDDPSGDTGLSDLLNKLMDQAGMAEDAADRALFARRIANDLDAANAPDAADEIRRRFDAPTPPPGSDKPDSDEPGFGASGFDEPGPDAPDANRPGADAPGPDGEPGPDHGPGPSGPSSPTPHAPYTDPDTPQPPTG